MNNNKASSQLSVVRRRKPRAETVGEENEEINIIKYTTMTQMCFKEKVGLLMKKDEDTGK